jgi:hypothetical protein
MMILSRIGFNSRKLESSINAGLALYQITWDSKMAKRGKRLAADDMAVKLLCWHINHQIVPKFGILRSSGAGE